MSSSRKPQEVNSPNKADRLVNRYVAPVALVAGLLLILLVTLNSFGFRFRALSAADYFSGFLIFPSSYLDFPLNILLFVPIGFGLASLLERARLSKRIAFLMVLLAGSLLTWLVESLQFFLPGRTPNVSDLTANILGTLVGLGCFRAWQNRRRFLAAVLKPRYLALGLLTYLILLAVLSMALRDRARLDYWRLQFPLLIGNEMTGDRPWKGDVSDLLFLDRALPVGELDALLSGSDRLNIAGDSLVAYYPLEDADSLVDKTGNLPDLRWSRGPGADPNEQSLQLDGHNWLETEWAVVTLAERFGATSQFTIKLSAATADLEQTNPARIISVSTNPYYRNLMLGQEGQDLIVRVRSPLTGVNGTRPELRFPGIFTDEETHTLIVTYDSLALTVYVDETEQAQRVEIVPGIAFFYTLFGPFAQTMTLGPPLTHVYAILFYLFIFVPIGIVLALITVQNRSRIQRIVLLALGIILPALLLELILSAKSNFEVRPANILLGAAVIAVSCLLFAPAARKTIRLWGSAQLQTRPDSGNGIQHQK